MAVVWDIPLPPPWSEVFILLGVVCASSLKEERREVRDLPILPNSKRMFGWFPHLVNSCFASRCVSFGVESYPILICNIFHFCDFWRYFWPDFDFMIWGVFLRFLPWIWVLGWASSSTSNLGVNPWLKPLGFHGFLQVPVKPRFLSSSKIGREIIGFGKNLFWELVPFIEVTLVYKFHPIWCPIA
jgi:hypothetical protein